MFNRTVFQGVPATVRRSAGIIRQQNRVFAATSVVAGHQPSSIDFSNAETAFKVVVAARLDAFPRVVRDS
jgi:hypothetical protein